MTSSSSAAQRAPAAAPRYDIEGLLKDLADIPVVTEMGTVRRKSRDYFWYSPILNKSLHGKSADVLVAPRNEADIIETAAACTKRRIPITVRAGQRARRRICRASSC
jgi:hypothetical protein